MASASNSETVASRLQRLPDAATAPLDALPADLLVPLPGEKFDRPTAEAPPAPTAVKALRYEIAAPPLQAAPAAARPAPPPRPTSPARRAGPRLESVPTAAIRPLAGMPQQRLETADLRALAASLKRHGMVVPLLVRVDPQRPGTLELFAGFRRWRAALLAKLPQVPAIIFEGLSESIAFEIGVLQNLHRRDLTVIEEAETFCVLADHYARTPDQIAALSGRTRNQVANMLCLVALPEEVRLRLRNGQIGFAHGRALLGLADPAALARRIVAERLTVEETERLATQLRAAASAGEPGPAPPEPAPDIAIAAPAEIPSPHDVPTLQAALSVELGAQTDVRANPADSTLLIQAGSPEQLASAVALLRDALRLLRTDRVISESSRNRRASKPR